MPETSIGDAFNVPVEPFKAPEESKIIEEKAGKTIQGNVVQPPRGKVAEMARRIEKALESEKTVIEPRPQKTSKPVSQQSVPGNKVSALKAKFEGSKESDSTEKKIENLHPERIIIHEKEEYTLSMPVQVHEKEEYTLSLPVQVHEKEEYTLSLPIRVHKEEEYTLSFEEQPVISQQELVDSLNEAHLGKAIQTELSEASAKELDQFTSDFVNAVENLAKNSYVPSEMKQFPNFYNNLSKISAFLLKNNDRLTPQQRDVLEQQLPKYREDILTHFTADFVAQAETRIHHVADDAKSISKLINQMGEISSFLLKENKNIDSESKKFLSETLCELLIQKGIENGYLQAPVDTQQIESESPPPYPENITFDEWLEDNPHFKDSPLLQQMQLFEKLTSRPQQRESIEEPQEPMSMELSDAPGESLNAIFLKALSIRNPNTFKGFDEEPLPKVKEMAKILTNLKQELDAQEWNPSTYEEAENIFGNIQTILSLMQKNDKLPKNEKERLSLEVQDVSQYVADRLFPLLGSTIQDFKHVSILKEHQIDESIAVAKALVERRWTPKTRQEADTMHLNMQQLRAALNQNTSKSLRQQFEAMKALSNAVSYSMDQQDLFEADEELA